jgi:hypothetical protein
MNSFTPKILTDAEPVKCVGTPSCKFVYYRCNMRSGYDTKAGIMRVCSSGCKESKSLAKV